MDKRTRGTDEQSLLPDRFVSRTPALGRIFIYSLSLGGDFRWAMYQNLDRPVAVDARSKRLPRPANPKETRNLERNFNLVW